MQRIFIWLVCSSSLLVVGYVLMVIGIFSNLKSLTSFYFNLTFLKFLEGKGAYFHLTIFCSAGVPLSKPLYTLSYMCITAGASGIVLIAIYYTVSLLL